MTARRQASTTSLAKYARGHTEEELSLRQLDYCNAFWGIADGGVAVLFARLRGTTRTMDDIRAFWKERAAIEEDYSKRLHALGNRIIGKDELYETRNSIETMRNETLNQAGSHRELMSTLRRVLETGVTEICTKQANFKRNEMANIEKMFKSKQAQEAYVEKAREKYEADCLKINSYTAQATLVQGRDFDKLQLKLDRARQTVQANERDYINFSRALADTYVKWEREWKAFCDKAQDLEDERIEFTKNNMWEYANTVSTACVQDDESCEKLRIALEAVDSAIEQENFVRDYTTGPLIPDPPVFIDYVNLDPNNMPEASTRMANYARSTTRPQMAMRPEDEEPTGNQAGIGAGGGNAPPPQTSEERPAEISQARSRANSRAQSIAADDRVAAPSTYGAPSTQGPTSPYAASAIVPPSTYAPLTSNEAPTMPKIGDRAYAVDVGAGSSSNGTGPSRANHVGDAADPLAAKLQSLQSAVSAGTNKRMSIHSSAVHRATSTSPVNGRSSSRQSYPASPSQRGLSIDYGAAAEAIVGAHPASRPTSPTPAAKFMQPPDPRSPSPTPVETVMSTYEQQLPGEHHARRLSRQNSFNRQSAEQAGAEIAARGRPVSREGHAGIGAHGRGSSISPAPPAVRHASTGSISLQRSTAATAAAATAAATATARDKPNEPAEQRRAAAHRHCNRCAGRVTEDTMADRYTGSRNNGYHQQTSSYPSPMPPQAQLPYGAPRQSSGFAPPATTSPVPHSGFSSPAPSAVGHSAAPNSSQYSVPGLQAANSAQAQQTPAAAYAAQYRGPPTAPPPVGFPPPTPQWQQQQLQQQQQQQQALQQPQYAQAQVAGRGFASPAPSNGGWSPGHQQQPSVGGYGAPSPAPTPHNPGYVQLPPHQPQRSPSPQPYQDAPVALPQQPPPPLAPPPTGQYLEDGRGVLFYVKALYDYRATIEEEFDFQKDDIIAVTSTPEDGWWTGWLLDDTRRQSTKNTFPSNFVCLF
ncbi:hypothetical protein BKA62DRAFT_640553 [Auriculariales sp. MPI-PUGE-AT-0066]|nr:hypothetical protein BKA62DRAFT_640553 [Auriculariales sp. MPI-PUGE-AT-0066]